jgi:hypothetical protein
MAKGYSLALSLSKCYLDNISLTSLKSN